MQTVIITGNLAKDAEVLTSKEGNELLRFDVAVNDGRDKDEKPTYYTCRMTVMGSLKVSVVPKDDKTFVNLDVWVLNLDLAPMGKEG